MLSPKNFKHKKMHKLVAHGIEYRGIKPEFGTYGLKILDNGRVTAKQLEAARRVMIRRIRKLGKIWIRVFPFLPVTAKPLEVRMGKGKGNVDYWAAPVKAGQIIFEIVGVSDGIAKELLLKAGHKLPFRIVVVKRTVFNNIIKL